jgi:phosphoglycerate dehydrogenase-like enzyme
LRIIFRGQVFQAELADLAERCNLNYLEVPDEATLLRELPVADALWITPTYYTAAIPAFFKDNPGKLRWIGLTSGGYDILSRIGVPPGVHLTYAAGVHAPSVAEHAVAQLLCLTRQLPFSLERQRSGKWDTSIIPQLRSIEDMDVAIVGFGGIGQQIAVKVRPLARRIVAVTRSGAPNALADETFTLSNLDEVLAKSDVVFLAVTMNKDSLRMIDARRIALMKRGALIVNICRGTVIEQDAMVAALRSGALRGAALDVTDPEPLPPDHPLWQAPNVMITPHISTFGSRSTGKRLADQFQRNIDRLARGQTLEGAITL